MACKKKNKNTHVFFFPPSAIRVIPCGTRDGKQTNTQKGNRRRSEEKKRKRECEVKGHQSEVFYFPLLTAPVCYGTLLAPHPLTKEKKKKTPLTTMNIAWLNKQSGMLISLEAGKKQAKKKTNEQKKKKRRLACVSGERLNHALCPYSCVPRAFFFFPLPFMKRAATLRCHSN